MDPDPLRAPDTDAIAWADQLDRAYEDGYAAARSDRPLLLQSTAFGLGLVVGMFLAVLLAYAQVAR